MKTLGMTPCLGRFVWPVLSKSEFRKCSLQSNVTPGVGVKCSLLCAWPHCLHNFSSLGNLEKKDPNDVFDYWHLKGWKDGYYNWRQWR